MDKLAGAIVKHRKAVMMIFLIAVIISVILQFFVKVNYDMTDYLPPDAQSTKALEIMNAEFTASVPNTSVMVRGVSLTEATEYKKSIADVPGVTEVLWLDDMVDIYEPVEMADSEMVEAYYKNGNALFSVTIEKGMEQETTDALQQLVGENNAVAGESPDLAGTMSATSSEVLNALVILLPAIIVLLILSTTSWVEPLLFLAAIGVSIIINMGTNISVGEISFMTNSVSPILQLAVSLDYAVFLLHSFQDYRKKTGDVDEAMKAAVKDSFSTVAASAMTTLFGFLALVFMNFRIGADLGLNLAKGIVLSFVTVVIFLPALTLSIYKLIDKTQHRPFLPSFKNVNRVLSKLAVPAVILVVLLIVPGFLGQRQTEFVYGNSSAAASTRTGKDSAAIEEEFGKSTIMVLLVPRGDVVRETEMCAEIGALDHVTGVMSYVSTVGAEIPDAYLDESIVGQFYSENYARVIVYTDTPDEGNLAFATVEEVQAVAASHYGDEAYSLGQSVNLYDMRNLVAVDNTMVNLIAVIAIFLVLVVTFKSATLPLILLITIETGIWVNLAIPYFTGTSINFIGYLVLSTVQLGATVDYAILLTDHYMKKRKLLPKKAAMTEALGASFKSIIVSASILSLAGFVLFATSTNPAISDIGLLLGRGTLLSFLMVVCFLPAMLTLLDGAIGKTTYKSDFFNETKKIRE